MCCIFSFTWYATYTREWFIKLHLCQSGSEKRWITACSDTGAALHLTRPVPARKQEPINNHRKKKTNFNTNNRNGDYLKVGWCVKYSVYAAEVIWLLMCRSILVQRVWDGNVTGLLRGVILVLSRNDWCEQ